MFFIFQLIFGGEGFQIYTNYAIPSFAYVGSAFSCIGYIGKYTDLKKKIMYAFFVCLFVLIDQSGYCYFCSVMRSFCVLRDGQGIFFNIHIYIFWGGGEDF